MLGFLMVITDDPTQVPNTPTEPVYSTGVGVQNLDSEYAIQLADDPSFPNQFIYVLGPGQWYTYTGSKTFWVRVMPGQTSSDGTPVAAINAWINPGGAANIGGVGGAVQLVEITDQPVLVELVTNDASQSLVNQPNSGTDFSYTLTDGGQLVLFQATLITSALAVERYPLLQFNIAGRTYRIPMSPNGISASSSFNFVGTPGYGPPYEAVGPNLMMFALPDAPLPPNTIISSSTVNLQAGDQWQNVSMSVS